MDTHELIGQLPRHLGAAEHWITHRLVDHPLWMVALGVVVYLLAEWTNVSSWKDPDRPQDYKTITPRSTAKAIRRAKKRKVRRHENEYPIPGAVVVGEFLVIIGGSGTGKTLRIIVPLVAYRLLEQRKSVLVLDPKGQILEETAWLLGRAAGEPKVFVFSTLGKHPNEIVSPINPMTNLEERLGFLKSAIPGEDSTRDSYFDNAGQRTASKVADAQIAEWGGTDLWQVFKAIDDVQEMDRLAKSHPGVRSVWRGSEHARGADKDARDTALTALQALQSHRIRRVFDTGGLESGVWEISPSFGERVVLYLCASVHDAKFAPGLIRAAMDHLIERAGHAVEIGGPAVEVVLEEAGVFGPLEDLQIYLNIMRGYGLNITVVLQTLEQLRARLGQDNAYSALSAGGILLFGPVTSIATGQWLEELSGTVRVRRPRKQRLLIMELLGVIPEAFFDSGKPHGARNRDPQEDDRILVPRFRAQHLYAFEEELEKLPFLERLGARIELVFHPRWSLKSGQFIMLARGRKPTLLDTRRNNQIWPQYAQRLLKKVMPEEEVPDLASFRELAKDICEQEVSTPEEARYAPEEFPVEQDEP